VGDAGPLDALTAVPLLGWFATWLAAGLAVLALLALVRRPVADAALAGIRRPGRSIALGTAVLAVTPFVIALLALSLLGALAALVLAAGLVMATALGAAVTGAAAGRAMLPRHDAFAAYVGWAAVGGALGLGLLISPLLALLLAGGVVAFGVGALVPVRQSADPAPDEDDDEPVADEPDEIDWESLLEADAPVEADIDPAGPRILAAFPLSTRD
jgi:hypothetical protein